MELFWSSTNMHSLFDDIGAENQGSFLELLSIKDAKNCKEIW